MTTHDYGLCNATGCERCIAYNVGLREGQRIAYPAVTDREEGVIEGVALERTNAGPNLHAALVLWIRRFTGQEHHWCDVTAGRSHGLRSGRRCAQGRRYTTRHCRGLRLTTGRTLAVFHAAASG